MKRENDRKYSPEVYEEACEWFVEFRTDTPAESTRRAFHSWLQEGPAHMAAYLDAAADWNRFGAMDVHARFPRALLVSEAMSGVDNILSHPLIRRMPAARPGSRPRARFALRPAGILTAGLAAIVIGSVILVAWMRAYPTFSTGIGQERVIKLADGSVVELNARSEIRVHYTKSERKIELVRGQALFTDVRDPFRPFVVNTQGTLVRAIGTEFDVNRRSTATIVTVVAGQVAVADMQTATSITGKHLLPMLSVKPPALHTIYLTAGEQVAIEPSIVSTPAPVNVWNVIAWTHRKLVFASTPLQDVVEAFNRYNARQLVITDPALRTLQIDGVFSSVNPSSLVDFLRQYPGVEVTESRQEIRISGR